MHYRSLLLGQVLYATLALHAQKDEKVLPYVVVVQGRECPCAEDGRVTQFAFKLADHPGLYTSYTNLIGCTSIVMKIPGREAPLGLRLSKCDPTIDAALLEPRGSSHERAFNTAFPMEKGLTLLEDSEPLPSTVRYVFFEGESINTSSAQQFDCADLSGLLRSAPAAKRNQPPSYVDLSTRIGCYTMQDPKKSIPSHKRYLGGPVWTADAKPRVIGFVGAVVSTATETEHRFGVTRLENSIYAGRFRAADIELPTEHERTLNAAKEAEAPNTSLGSDQDLFTYLRPGLQKPKPEQPVRTKMWELMPWIKEHMDDPIKSDAARKKLCGGGNIDLDQINMSRKNLADTSFRTLSFFVACYSHQFCTERDSTEKDYRTDVALLNKFAVNVSDEEETLLDVVGMSPEDIITFAERSFVRAEYGAMVNRLAANAIDPSIKDSLDFLEDEVSELKKWLRIIDHQPGFDQARAKVIKGWKMRYEVLLAECKEKMIKEHVATGDPVKIRSRVAKSNSLPPDVAMRITDEAIKLENKPPNKNDRMLQDYTNMSLGFSAYMDALDSLEAVPDIEFSHESYADSLVIILKIHGGPPKHRISTSASKVTSPSDTLRVCQRGFPLGHHRFNGCDRAMRAFARYTQQHFDQAEVETKPNRVIVIGSADATPVKGELKLGPLVNRALADDRPDISDWNEKLAFGRGVTARLELEGAGYPWVESIPVDVKPVVSTSKGPGERYVSVRLTTVPK